MPISRERCASRRARDSSTSSSPSAWNHLSATLASLTTSIALIAALSLGADQVRRLKGADPLEGGSPAGESGLDRGRIGPTEFSTRSLLKEAAPGRPSLVGLAVDPIEQIV